MLANFEFEGDGIREQNGLFSIYDCIRVIGGKKSQSEVWKRLGKQYPDIVTKCESVKFARSDGKKANLASPAGDRQLILEIIGLLPGAVGRAYRENAAKLFLRYIDADITLADEILQKNQNPEDVAWLQERIKGKQARMAFTDELKRRGVTGVGYAMNTNAIYQGVLGKPAKKLKQERCLEKRQNLRDEMSQMELSAIRLAELGATENFEKKQAIGNQQTTKISQSMADIMGEALRKMREA